MTLQQTVPALLDETEARRARFIAIEIARRILDNALVEKREYAADGISRILLYCEIERIDDSRDWPSAIHAELMETLRVFPLRDPHVPLGVYGGLGALLIAVTQAGRVGRYSGLRRELSELFRERANAQAYDSGVPLFSIMDILNGAAGILLTLNLLGDQKPKSPPQLDYFRWLTDDPTTTRSRLYTRGSPFKAEEPRLYLGVAHGVAGLLAGICASYPQCTRIIKTLTGILRDTMKNPESPAWPPYLSDTTQKDESWAWCHGTPGIAVALTHASNVLGEPDLLEIARRAMCNHPSRPIPGIVDHGLCHGTSGFALMCYWVGLQSCERKLHAIATDYFGQVIDSFNPDYKFGYRANAINGPPQDLPEFLKGASGIAMALATAAGSSDLSWTTSLAMGEVSS